MANTLVVQYPVMAGHRDSGEATSDPKVDRRFSPGARKCWVETATLGNVSSTKRRGGWGANGAHPPSPADFLVPRESFSGCLEAALTHAASPSAAALGGRAPSACPQPDRVSCNTRAVRGLSRGCAHACGLAVRRGAWGARLTCVSPARSSFVQHASRSLAVSRLRSRMRSRRPPRRWGGAPVVHVQERDGFSAASHFDNVGHDLL